MRNSLFKILYGMHPRGVSDLIDLGKLERRSAHEEDFVAPESDLDEEMK